MSAQPAHLEANEAELARIAAIPYGLKGFCRFAALLGLEVHPFQRYMLGQHFRGVRELVVLISKKNGKTTLMGALALYRLLTMPGAEVVIGASSRDQATILFNQAARLILDNGLERKPLPGNRREPTRYEGVFEIRDGYRVIRYAGGRIRVFAADADTADGVIPDLAIVDELHRHKSGALYGVFRDGLLGDAQMVTISTAGASLDSPLGHLLEKAQAFAVKAAGRRLTFTSPDGSFVLVEWALRGEDDPDDVRLVKTVNPAPWHTVTSLRQRHDSPSTSRGQWLRFACGIWTEGDEPAITGAEWDRLRSDFQTVELGDTVTLAPSVGGNAAIGIASRREEGRVAIKVEVIPPTMGRSILADTEERLIALMDAYDVEQIAFDSRTFMRSADLLMDNEGLPMQRHDHSPARLIGATGTFEKLRRSGALIHDGDPTLRQHVLAALLKVTETGERYMASDRARGMIAVMMATHAATAPVNEPIIVLPGSIG